MIAAVTMALRGWMRTLLASLRRQWLQALLAAALALFWLQVHFAVTPTEPSRWGMFLHAEQGDADMSLRNADFPNTFIKSITVDLTSPHHWVRLTWDGPQAYCQESGPFHSSPGRGQGDNDCNDIAESNRGQSGCTPKGTRHVEAFSEYMENAGGFKFVTWIHASREIGFHSHYDLPEFPASHGCVRLDRRAAQLIHNNAVAGATKVIVEGTWTRAPDID